jgi:hypothetical protein
MELFKQGSQKYVDGIIDSVSQLHILRASVLSSKFTSQSESPIKAHLPILH